MTWVETNENGEPVHPEHAPIVVGVVKGFEIHSPAIPDFDEVHNVVVLNETVKN